MTMNKKRILKGIASLNIQHISWLMTIFIILYFLLPGIVLTLHIKLPNIISGNLTSDSLLNYFGTIIGCLLPLALSVISLKQSIEISDLQELLEIDRKRQMVFPDLYIINAQDTSDSVKIKNYSMNTACNLIISCENYCSDEFSVLPGNEEIEITIPVEHSRIISITYGDSIGSCINRNFTKSQNRYILLETNYDI